MSNEESWLRQVRESISSVGVRDVDVAATEAFRSSLDEEKPKIRRGLQQHGTDVETNDNDPSGDGDQSPIHLGYSSKQHYRDLFASGGDLLTHINHPRGFSSFALACIKGDVKFVKGELKRMETASQQDRIRLLETRETSMRLTPLHLILSVGKTLMTTALMSPIQPKHEDHLEIAKLLLKYGARVDARDVCGKSVCHYGAGVMATSTTMQIVTWCCQAYTSRHFLFRDTELHSLKTASRNGQRGIAKGFDVDSGRRLIYLEGEDETNPLAIKPENLKLVHSAVQDDFKDEKSSCTGKKNKKKNKSKKKDPLPAPDNLIDSQDRLGGTCLLEVAMSNKTDIADFLLDKCLADIEVADLDGFSPKKLAVMNQMGSSVCPMIMKRAVKDARRAKKAEEDVCAQCGESSKPVGACSKCHSVSYCSRDCQVADWKAGHKAVCKSLAKEKKVSIVLEKPVEEAGTTKVHVPFSNATGKTWKAGSYQKPSHVKVDELFYIKIQANSEHSPLMIYEKSRECFFYYQPGQRGFQEMLVKVQSDLSAGGRKTYMAASFTASGDCIVYPEQTTVQKW